jgi:hypothetical protein
MISFSRGRAMIRDDQQTFRWEELMKCRNAKVISWRSLLEYEASEVD